MNTDVALVKKIVGRPETEYIYAASNVKTPQRSHTQNIIILHFPTPKANKCLLCSPHRICEPPSGTTKRLDVDLSPGKPTCEIVNFYF